MAQRVPTSISLIQPTEAHKLKEKKQDPNAAGANQTMDGFGTNRSMNASNTGITRRGRGNVNLEPLPDYTERQRTEADETKALINKRRVV